jgi:hypothetical protein
MPFWSKPPTPAGPTKATTMLPSSGENGIASKPPPLSREAQADAELAALMRELDAEHQANAAAAKHASVTHVTDDDKTGLPTDMNCLTAFDEMFYCYSLGGQFLNIYRYGGFQDCSEKSADWRFCMKSKVRGEVARRVSFLNIGMGWKGKTDG